MKKLIALIAILSVVGISIVDASPRLRFPQSSNGDAVHPDYGGYTFKHQTTSAEAVICTGKCLLAAVFLSTGVLGNWVQFRDTSTADIGGGVILPVFTFSPEASNTTPTFNRPIITVNGISLEYNGVSAGETVTVLYLDLDD